MSVNMDDERDGVLFRFWIRMAAEQPALTARTLTNCVTANDYRRALTALAQQLKINLPALGE